MTTLRKQSEAAVNLRDQLKRSLKVTGSDLAGALSEIAKTAGYPDKEDEYHYEEEAVDGTTDWFDGWYEDESDE